MLMKKAVGRGGATRKYDLLTILGVYALSQDKTLQRQTLRLICLITARYNWQADQLCVGQTEIARLWSVDARTVKREMAAFRARGWLIEKRAAARGRVTQYGLATVRILEDTRAVWEKVGPDLVERLKPAPMQEPQGQGAQVIPFPQVPMAFDATLWGRVSQHLHDADPAIFRAWFATLTATSEGNTLCLQAPSGFHATYIKTHFATRIEHVLAQLSPGIRLRIL